MCSVYIRQSWRIIYVGRCQEVRRSADSKSNQEKIVNTCSCFRHSNKLEQLTRFCLILSFEGIINTWNVNQGTDSRDRTDGRGSHSVLLWQSVRPQSIHIGRLSPRVILRMITLIWNQIQAIEYSCIARISRDRHLGHCSTVPHSPFRTICPARSALYDRYKDTYNHLFIYEPTILLHRTILIITSLIQLKTPSSREKQQLTDNHQSGGNRWPSIILYRADRTRDDWSNMWRGSV